MEQGRHTMDEVHVGIEKLLAKELIGEVAKLSESVGSLPHPFVTALSLLRTRCWRHHSVDTVVRHQQSVMLRGVLGHVHPRIHGLPEGTIRQSLKNGVGFVDRFFEHRYYSRLSS